MQSRNLWLLASLEILNLNVILKQTLALLFPDLTLQPIGSEHMVRWHSYQSYPEPTRNNTTLQKNYLFLMNKKKKKKLKVISKRPSKRIAAKFAKTRAIFKICIPDQCKTARSLQHLDSNAAVTKSINSSSYFLTDTLFDRRF